MLPVVAIVGRPNVGKSTLFNRFVGHKKAIVDDRPGVTRDRNYGEGSFLGQKFIFIDTGGFEPEPDSDLFSEMRKQALVALEEADVFIFVVDRKSGITPADRMTAAILRKELTEEQIEQMILVVNKCDGHMHDIEALEFFELGFGEPITIAAEHNRGMYELWEKVVEHVPKQETWVEEEEDGEIRVAILGRPNIGKSTLINRLLGEERHVVCDMPGTTMDAIDSVIEINGQKFRFVDTAGIRRPSKIDDKLESIAVSHAIRTIERCHICLLMIDGVDGVAKQDARLASLISERGRGCLLLINKWDKVKNLEERNSVVLEDEIYMSLPHLSWASRLFISALTGKGCTLITEAILTVYKEFNTRIPTARLNKVFETIVANNPPPQKHNHRVRLNYVTQARVRPPTFIIWANSPEAIPVSYKRYLENQMRSSFGFAGTPLRIQFRKKRKQWEDGK